MFRLVLCAVFAASVLLLPASSSRAAPIPKASTGATPVVTAQALPASRLLEIARGFVEKAAGKNQVASMDESIKVLLGEKGFDGLNLLRPIGGYASIDGKPEEWWGVLVVPITEEKAFVDLLQRAKFTVEPMKETAGLYKLTPGSGDDSIPLLLRVLDKNAYIGVNTKPAVLELAKLVPTTKLIQPDETGAVAVRVDLTRISPDLKKQLLELIDMGIETAEAPARFPQPIDLGVYVGSPFLKEMKKLVTRIGQDGELFTARLRLDPNTFDIAQEFVMKAKDGSPLAVDIAAFQPGESRFAGMVPNSCVGSGVVRMPLFTADLRTAAEKLTNQLVFMARENAVDETKPMIDEIGKTVLRSIQAKELEVAGGLLAANKNGHHTAIGAIGLDDPTGIEKAFRDALKNAPKPIQAVVKLDAAKIGEYSVHTAQIGPVLGVPDALFGENATLHLVFTKKAIFAAFGPDSLTELKRMVALKPGPAAFMDFRINPKKLFAIIQASGGFVPPNVGITEYDVLIPVQVVDISGGKELKVKTTILSFPVLGFTAMRVGP